jgi:two-component system OmpR family response regulator
MSCIYERVEDLKAGADYYLIKPFAFNQLYARFNTLPRRPRETMEQKVIQVCGIEIDLIKRMLKRYGQLIYLQTTEIRLIEYLAYHAGQVFNKPGLKVLVSLPNGK